jgi:hypothetical protein
VMTVTLDQIGRESVEVELPMACPHCGLSFEEEDALLEEGYGVLDRFGGRRAAD